MNVKLLIDTIAILDLQCNEILASNTSLLISIKSAMNLLANHYAEAKEDFNKGTFESTDEQIEYFKLYHPKMLSLCLFYKSIQRIEQRLLSKSMKKQLKILKEEVEALDYISQDHHEFIIYITEKASHFDKDYFTIDTERKPFDSFSFIERDPTFSTHHSFLLAKILSGNRTLDYINSKLDGLKNRSTQNNATLITLKWNRKKVDYIETIRALHAEGAFTEDVTTVFKALSQVILTGPLDHYSQFNDIKNRATSVTKYLTKAAHALEKYIEEGYE